MARKWPERLADGIVSDFPCPFCAWDGRCGDDDACEEGVLAWLVSERSEKGAGSRSRPEKPVS